MIQSTKWYGLKAHSPEEYFKDACHSYQDVSDLLDRKGTNILRDIKPSLESFIHESDTITSDLLIERLLVTNKSVATDIAMESIKYTVENIDKLKPEADNSAWFIWSDIPKIRASYRMGKINESAIEVLQNALESCAYKVASNLTTCDTIAIESIVDSFNNSINWEDMMNWNEVRESKLDNPEAVYIGDLISELSMEDCKEISLEGVMSDIDLSLQDITSELRRKNSNVKGSLEGYRNLVNDIWVELAEANEETFDTIVESVYHSRQMTISIESYLSSINRMIREGCLPPLNGITESHISDLSKYMLGQLEPAEEGTHVNIKNREYNLNLWQRKPGQNILYVTGYSGSGKTTYAKNVARKTQDCVSINSDRFICEFEDTTKYGDNSKQAMLLKEFYKTRDYTKQYEYIRDDNTLGDYFYRDRTKDFIEWIQKIARSDSKTLYVVEGTWFMHYVSPSFFKDKPLVILGTSVHKSVKRAGFRDGEKKSWQNDKYYYKSQEKVRADLIKAMDNSVTESMLLEDTNICDNYGMIYNIENDIRDLEMMSFDYIAKESSDGMEDKVSDKHKLARKVKEGVRKSEREVSKAYNQYKLHEDDIDKKLTHIFKKCKGVVFGSSEEARRQIVEGKGYSVVNVLKYIIGGYAVFSVSKVAFFLVLIVRWCNSGKIKRSERKKIIAELEAEKEVIESKIEDARMDGNRDAVNKLIRTKHNIIAAEKRIKKRDEAEHNGIGAGEVLLNKG